MATTFAVPDGRVAMAATLYTGNGSTQSISNAVNTVSFQPDLVWMKARVAGSHNLVDSVRGVNKVLFSDATTAETTYTDNLTSFNVGGFSVGASASSNVNINTNTYVGWQWNAGGTTVTNGTGTISSQVRANTTAGFSVVTYTGTGVAATVGHGLGAVPSLIIVKNKSNAAMNWLVYSSTQGANKYGYLNLTNAWATDVTGFNNVTPTNAVFSVGTATETNGAAQVAYCWAPVAGYSAFGSYTGNGSADGPFIYTGFRPRWIMIKRTDATLSWGIFDTSRNPSNVVDLQLYANLAVADNTFTTMDIVSNGFKSRSATEYNTSGGTYIYAAFAENPLRYSNAR